MSIDGTALLTAEMARAVEVDDVVLVHAAAVDVLEREDAIEHEERDAGLGERPEIATGSLYREHADEFTRDRVGEGELRRGVPSGVVRDPPVGAEPMGPVEQVPERADPPHQPCSQL